MLRRPSQCTVCQHRERTALDLALARGVGVRALSRRYRLSIDALYRHSNRHLPPQLRAKLIAGPSVDGVDLDRLRDTESQSLLMNLIALRNRLLAGLDAAEEAGDSGMVARVANQLHRNLEITGELLGDLSTGSTTINNVLVMPAYIEMRMELVRALAPYPEARLSVAAVLHRIESKAAEAIRLTSEEGLAR
jgi:hypothetical protein